jgi:hypothetical protein
MRAGNRPIAGRTGRILAGSGRAGLGLAEQSRAEPGKARQGGSGRRVVEGGSLVAARLRRQRSGRELLPAGARPLAWWKLVTVGRGSGRVGGGGGWELWSETRLLLGYFS